jgi:hypothetical protein
LAVMLSIGNVPNALQMAGSGKVPTWQFIAPSAFGFFVFITAKIFEIRTKQEDRKTERAIEKERRETVAEFLGLLNDANGHTTAEVAMPNGTKVKYGRESNPPGAQSLSALQGSNTRSSKAHQQRNGDGPAKTMRRQRAN